MWQSLCSWTAGNDPVQTQGNASLLKPSSHTGAAFLIWTASMWISSSSRLSRPNLTLMFGFYQEISSLILSTEPPSLHQSQYFETKHWDSLNLFIICTMFVKISSSSISLSASRLISLMAFLLNWVDFFSSFQHQNFCNCLCFNSHI